MKNKHYLPKHILAPILAAGLGWSGISHAALVDRGGGMIYDTELDVTWLSDTHYASLEFSANPNRVNEIIGAVGAVAGHTLTTSDFDTAGGNIGVMSWWGATAWADQLVYGGYSDWRLPNSDGVTVGRALTQENELGYLNNVTAPLEPNFGDYFPNYRATRYWLAQENTQDPNKAWFINFAYSGNQNPSPDKTLHSYAWALRDGDVAAVPLPAAVWLFGSGLGLLVFKRRHAEKA